MQRAPGHRSKLTALLIPLSVLGWVCRGLLRGELFFERDQLLVFLPLKRYVAERLRAGDLPDWWPWDALGQPLAALPIASLFHPTTLSYLALPFEWAFTLQTLIPFPVALLGSWYLARTLGLRAWGATLAATLFTGGFYFVALAEQTQMHLAAMSLPWVWREAVRLARNRRARGVGLGLAVANLLLGGDPMLLELAAFSTLALVLSTSRGRSRAGLGRVALWAGLGVLLAAVQWVPMLHVFAESPRAAGLGVDVKDFWAVRGAHLLGAVVPGSFVPESFLFEATYMGAAALLLSVLGFSQRWKWRWPLLGVVVVSLLLGAGRAAGLWQVFSAVVPGWQGFQFPAKALSCAALALALAAGRGLDVASRGRLALRGAPWLAALGLAAAALFWAGAGAAAGACVVLAVLLALLTNAAPSRPVKSAVLALAVVLVGVDQAAHGPRIDTRPWSALAEPPLAGALRQLGVGLGKQSFVYAWLLPQNGDLGEANRRQHRALRPVQGALYGLPTAVPYLQGFTRRYYDVALADRSAWVTRRAAIFGASGFVVRSDGLQPAMKERVLWRDPEPELDLVLLGARAQPAAYVSFNLRRVPEAQTVERLGAPGFTAGRDVLLPADGLWAVPENFEQETGAPPQPVAVDAHEGDVVRLTVTLERPGVLVFNEAFTAATEVFDGDEPLAAFPANHAALGVALTPGTHRLRIERRTPGLELGLGLSALALLAALVALRSGSPRSGNGR